MSMNYSPKLRTRSLRQETKYKNSEMQLCVFHQNKLGQILLFSDLILGQIESNLYPKTNQNKSKRGDLNHRMK